MNSEEKSSNLGADHVKAVWLPQMNALRMHSMIRIFYHSLSFFLALSLKGQKMKTFNFRVTLKKLVLLLMVALAPSSAYCGSLTGKIVDFFYFQPTPTIVFITIAGTSSGGPACATYTSQMTLDISNPSGKATYTHLLALKLTSPNAIVTLSGTNNCNLYGDRESVMYVSLS